MPFACNVIPIGRNASGARKPVEQIARNAERRFNDDMKCTGPLVKDGHGARRNGHCCAAFESPFLAEAVLVRRVEAATPQIAHLGFRQGYFDGLGTRMQYRNDAIRLMSFAARRVKRCDDRAQVAVGPVPGLHRQSLRRQPLNIRDKRDIGGIAGQEVIARESCVRLSKRDDIGRARKERCIGSPQFIQVVALSWA